MTTLTAKTRKKFASEFTSNINKLYWFLLCGSEKTENILLLFFSVQYMKPTVSTTMLMDGVTRAATQRSVDGMDWIVQ